MFPPFRRSLYRPPSLVRMIPSTGVVSMGSLEQSWNSQRLGLVRTSRKGAYSTCNLISPEGTPCSWNHDCLFVGESRSGVIITLPRNISDLSMTFKLFDEVEVSR